MDTKKASKAETVKKQSPRDKMLTVLGAELDKLPDSLGKLSDSTTVEQVTKLAEKSVLVLKTRLANEVDFKWVLEPKADE